MWKSSMTSDSDIHPFCFYILKGFEINSPYTSKCVTHLVPVNMCVCVFIDCQSLTPLHIEMIKVVRYAIAVPMALEVLHTASSKTNN